MAKNRSRYAFEAGYLEGDGGEDTRAKYPYNEPDYQRGLDKRREEMEEARQQAEEEANLGLMLHNARYDEDWHKLCDVVERVMDRQDEILEKLEKIADKD